MRHFLSVNLATNERWSGEAVSEPYECGWAGEALLFLRCLDPAPDFSAGVQISPDGMHWADSGDVFGPASRDGVRLARVERFGGFLRVTASLPPGAEARVIVTLHAKS